MRVLINGLPYFGKRIAKELNEFDSENQYIFLDTYYSSWDKIRFRLLLPFSGAVFSFNGVSDRSGSLELALNKGKKLLMQWHGTDVSLALERYTDGSIYKKYIDNASHLFSAPWFQEELKEIVPKGVYAPFSYVNAVGNEGQYESISVLSYLAKGRESYYGWNELCAVAHKNPNISFNIVGTDGMGLSAPENIKFLGWISDDEMVKLYRIHPIFVRLCEHDGKAFSVSQAMAAGAEVIWNYKLDNVRTITRNEIELADAILNAAESVKTRGMKPNVQAIQYALENLTEEIVMKEYAKIIQSELVK